MISGSLIPETISNPLVSDWNDTVFKRPGPQFGDRLKGHSDADPMLIRNRAFPGGQSHPQTQALTRRKRVNPAAGTSLGRREAQIWGATRQRSKLTLLQEALSPPPPQDRQPSGRFPTAQQLRCMCRQDACEMNPTDLIKWSDEKSIGRSKAPPARAAGDLGVPLVCRTHDCTLVQSSFR